MTLLEQVVVALTYSFGVCINCWCTSPHFEFCFPQRGLPVEGLGLVIAVDRIVDMPRTINNIFGDASATIVACKLDGLIDENSPLLKKKIKD